MLFKKAKNQCRNQYLSEIYLKIYSSIIQMSAKTPIIGSVNNVHEIIYSDMLNLYAHELSLDSSKTFHQCYADMHYSIKEAFDVIKNGHVARTIRAAYPIDIVENIDDMNEMYITAVGAKGSDRVFETEHLDGPFFFLPFCVVLRCVYAVRGNRSICTEFPSSENWVVLETNGFLAFDYNRDTHYIWRNDEINDTSVRVLLKMHYLVTPEFLPRPIARFYSVVNSKYNKFMRFLFLRSQEKETVLSRTINYGTTTYCLIYKNLDAICAAGFALLLYSILK